MRIRIRPVPTIGFAKRLGALAWTALFLLYPALASATGDFAGLAICSRLKAIPTSAKLSECNARTPLRGECRFRLGSANMPVEYLIGDGVVLQKSLQLNARMKHRAPYGITGKDTSVSAARKIKTHTGLSSEHWGDNEDPNFSYLQSDSIACDAATAYSIFVWFDKDRATRVSVSMLPAL